MPWHLSDQQYQTLKSSRREQMFNSKLFLPPVMEEFRQRIHTYTEIIKQVYGYYIENVVDVREIIRHEIILEEYILPFSNISFYSTVDNYDNGTIEYYLHHHYSEHEQNRSISPFVGLSGLTHEIFMKNFNSHSWDLAYYIDLSSKVIQFVDIDCMDNTGVAYHLNSYAYDFFIIGSQKLLIEENTLERGNVYNLLLDFNLVISSIKISLEIVIVDEKKQISSDLRFFQQLYDKIKIIHKNLCT
ncbi:unnamed protein product [Didymodactylos carnosus]|uniref:Uncharacterized protein n=2 Tax=Didymodactylos carnosus TaxID=1234261 RepID=A0A8S2VUW6_9BILA|nr:unnamed protein product [Didymodactylos carnosus]